MRMISYRAKSRLKKLGIGLLITLAVLLAVWLCWLIWLQRFIVYTGDGVYFDFSRSSRTLSGEVVPWEAETSPTVAIEYVDGSEATESGEEATRFLGYSITTQMLLSDMDGVRAAVKKLPAGSVVLLDVKSIYGNFYYSTSLTGASTSDSIDPAAMDALIGELRSAGMYLVARLPAFRDSAFALEHTSSALALSGGALWTDSDHCYWLDPSSETVMTNLSQICRELTERGFDEVAFYDFYFPDSGSIVYNAAVSKADSVRAAAKRLADAFTTDAFKVSFCSGSLDFPLPDSAGHLYLTGADPEQADTLAQTAESTFGAGKLVFLTDSRDTRLEVASVVRALIE